MEKYIVPIIIAVVVLLAIIIFMCNYIKVPPNVALIVSGRKHRYKVKDAEGKETVKSFGYRIVRGGATFVIPFFERVDKLNLGIMQVDIKTTQPVPSQEYIGVLVDGVANIKIGSDDVSVATAAEQFLGWKQQEIAAVAMQVLEGNMREIIGRMTISDLVQNRDKFANETQNAATADMRNMGLEIVNITIQNFSDNDGVLDTLAVKNIAEKKRDADIARAEAERDTLIRQSIADQEGNKARAEANATIAEQNKVLELRRAQFRAEQDRAKADADLAYQVQQENARKALETERAAAELIRLQKETELQAQQVQIQREKLSIEVRERAQAERDAKIAAAEAERMVTQARAEAELFKTQKEAEAKLILAQREAEAQFVLAEKEAEAIRMKGEAEAEAMLKKAEAMKQYGQAAMMQMVIDKLPDMAKAVSEPLSKTDKIILFGEGGATSMARDTAGTMLQTFEAVKDAVGLDIPRMLKDVTTGGLIGKAIADEEKPAAEAQNGSRG
ncbi:MAG: SPFH domain-containing protein [Clostridiales bacterium]|nr:SPFH domain-containing protein [Clostridiales bacterium]